MAKLPIDEAVRRFSTNEERFDTFANGDEAEQWQDADGRSRPSIRKFLADVASLSPDAITLLQEAIAKKVGEGIASADRAEVAAAAAKSVLPVKYTKATKAELDAVTGTTGDMAFVTDTQANGGGYYRYGTTAWVYTGQGELANKASKTDVAAIAQDVLDLRNIAAPGDSVVIVAAQNGPALVTLKDGTTRGNFVPDDVQGLVTKLAELSAPEPPEVAKPSDSIVLVEAANGPALTMRQDGVLRGTFLAEDILGLGDTGGGGGGEGAAVEFADPDNVGEAWNSIKTTDAGGEVFRYLSTQWGGNVWGFEKRGTVTLAQTQNPALGIVSFGGGSSGVIRALPDDFPYHVVNETLLAPKDGLAATAQAVAHLTGERAIYRGLPTVVALSQVLASTVEADALPGAPARTALIQRIAAAKAALAPWGKELFIDRIALALLEGAPATPKATADLHYAAVANGLRMEVAEAAGQAPLPMVVVSQSAGTRTDGTSEVILAEGELDFAHFSLAFVIAGPRYPYPLEPGTAATLTAQSALLLSELEAIAVSERLARRPWYGPCIDAQCSIAGRVITAPFTALSNLILRDPANHGFTVAGVTNGATIESVAVSGTSVLITMTAEPLGELTVHYAWGQTGDRGDGFTANRGSLTDQWSQASRLVSGATHYRHARSGRAPVVR
ncbi:hypothetical protein [Falsirhodobacter sp. 1013]|uniref:hypothetical protein n=1 Tax=Falsirhodobacter sp. 1013 TaxID=3417566 RepID=UPI003EB78A04